MIPKPDGGERPLGIPTIRDRVVEQAAKLVVEPIFEADFEPDAYGCRPGRSALDAVNEARASVPRGETHVVDVDFSKYFDTIPHDELMRSRPTRPAGWPCAWTTVEDLEELRAAVGAFVEDYNRDGFWRRTAA